MEVENEATVTLVSTVVLLVVVVAVSLRSLEAGVLVVVGIVTMSYIQSLTFVPFDLFSITYRPVMMVKSLLFPFPLRKCRYSSRKPLEKVRCVSGSWIDTRLDVAVQHYEVMHFG